MFSALGIPGAYLGEDDGESGFDSGTNLTLKSAQFAKKIKRLQNTLIQAITDAMNLILVNKGLYSYINEFTIRMQPPTTQEEQDRRENLNGTISAIDSQMRLLSDNGIEDPATKLEILKIYLAEAGINSDILNIIQREIDKLSGTGEGEGGSGESSGDDFGSGGDFGDMDFDLGGGDEAEPVDLGGEDTGTEDTGEAEPVDLGEIEGGAEEGFQQGRGQELLNERTNLPTFDQLGISYADVKLNR